MVVESDGDPPCSGVARSNRYSEPPLMTSPQNSQLSHKPSSCYGELSSKTTRPRSKPAPRSHGRAHMMIAAGILMGRIVDHMDRPHSVKRFDRAVRCRASSISAATWFARLPLDGQFVCRTIPCLAQWRKAASCVGHSRSLLSSPTSFVFQPRHQLVLNGISFRWTPQWLGSWQSWNFFQMFSPASSG